MIHLNLDQEETLELFQLLEKTIADLNDEIARTERSEYREQLKTRQKTLRHILSQMRAGISTPMLA